VPFPAYAAVVMIFTTVPTPRRTAMLWRLALVCLLCLGLAALLAVLIQGVWK
jgi:hypothetical protein